MTREAYPCPEFDTPSYQVLEDTLGVVVSALALIGEVGLCQAWLTVCVQVNNLSM